MTGNVAIELAISIGGIALLLVLIWRTFPSVPVTLTPTKLQDFLAHQEPGLVIAQWLLDPAGDRALGVSDSGQLIVIDGSGGDLVHRLFDRADAREVLLSGNLITFHVNDPFFRKIKLTASSEDEAAHWARRLSVDYDKVVR